MSGSYITWPAKPTQFKFIEHKDLIVRLKDIKSQVNRLFLWRANKKDAMTGEYLTDKKPDLQRILNALPCVTVSRNQRFPVFPANGLYANITKELAEELTGNPLEDDISKKPYFFANHMKKITDVFEETIDRYNKYMSDDENIAEGNKAIAAVTGSIDAMLHEIKWNETTCIERLCTKYKFEKTYKWAPEDEPEVLDEL